MTVSAGQGQSAHSAAITAHHTGQEPRRHAHSDLIPIPHQGCQDLWIPLPRSLCSWTQAPILGLHGPFLNLISPKRDSEAAACGCRHGWGPWGRNRGWLAWPWWASQGPVPSPRRRDSAFRTLGYREGTWGQVRGKPTFFAQFMTDLSRQDVGLHSSSCWGPTDAGGENSTLRALEVGCLCAGCVFLENENVRI